MLLGSLSLGAAVADSADLLGLYGVDEFVVGSEGFPHLVGDKFAPLLFHLGSLEQALAVPCEVGQQLEVFEQRAIRRRLVRRRRRVVEREAGESAVGLGGGS